MLHQNSCMDRAGFLAYMFSSIYAALSFREIRYLQYHGAGISPWNFRPVFRGLPEPNMAWLLVVYFFMLDQSAFGILIM